MIFIGGRLGRQEKAKGEYLRDWMKNKIKRQDTSFTLRGSEW